MSDASTWATAVDAALRAMAGRRALLVGDVLLDAYVYGETGRVSREAPVLVVRKQHEENRLGGAANTAANLAALGLRTDLVSIVGNDAHGERLLGLLAAKGVATDAVARAGQTAVKTRVLAGAPGTARQQVLRVDALAEQEPPAETLTPLAAAIEQRAAAADVIVVSDYGQGVVTGPVLRRIQSMAAAGTMVCVDSRRRLAAFSGMHAITPNLPEAELLTGIPLSDRAAVDRAGTAILEQYGHALCLLTQGRGGMSLYARDGAQAHVDIVGEDEVADVTGAGDTVTAVFAAALAAGLGPRNGMRLANCAAGVVVTKMGAAVAEPHEIRQCATRFGVEMEPWDGLPS